MIDKIKTFILKDFNRQPMVEKIKLWEELGVPRPSSMGGGDRPLALIEKKLNEIIEAINKQ